MRALLAIGSIACVLASGCRPPKELPGGTTLSSEDVPSAKPGDLGASTLGAGDLVEVRVFSEQDLSGAFRVSPEGTIDYPLCGKVTLTSMTSSQAADAITACLKSGYLKRPQVSVMIREYNSKKIFVFGEVQRPGTFPYEQEMSIIQAITAAGGFTKLAAKNNTNVTRLIDGQEQKIRVPVEDIGVGRQKNFALQPGDIVFVPESFF
jgi:protein involved in polysaccharide export with SLBB domain